MMFKLLISLLTSFTANASAQDCLDGFYDLGKQAASIGIQCKEDQNDQAILVFCKRDLLLNKGLCTGQNHPVNCIWQEDNKAWFCDEQNVNYPFTAFIKRASPTTINYLFKSSFNEGSLTGQLIE